MNVINVGIDFKRGICQNKGISVVTGDYNSTKVVFDFSDEIDGTKIFEMKNPEGELVYADEIVNNEVVLVGYKEENGEIETYSLFGEEGDYIFEVSLYGNDSKLTSVSGYINAKKEEVIVDGEEVQEKITLFDNLINTLNEKIEETDNLDIDVSKEDKTTTVSITKKDGTPKSEDIYDGIGLNYNWQSTSLGIKREDEQNYQYVDLKGEKGDAGAIKMLIVNELPTTGEQDTIYLVPLENPTEEGNNYAEYVYINGEWELLGKIGVQVDLTDYYTKTETNTLLDGKVGFTDYASSSKGGVIKAVSSMGYGVSSTGVLQSQIANYSNYESASNYYNISKGTLENVITGKGLVSNTDYATKTTSGVINAGGGYAFNVSNNGNAYCDSLNYTQYTNSYWNNTFISKGTLENVITGKDLTTKAYVDGLVGNIQTLLDNLNTGSGA